MNESRENSDYKKYYELGNKLGQGGNGAVYIVKSKETKEQMAIKILDKKKMKEQIMGEKFYEPSEEDMKRYIDVYFKEIKNMEIAEGKNKENENTVKFIEYFNTKDEFCIVMELCDENLTNFVANINRNLNSEEVYEILSQLNNTFRIISVKKIAHRDIKLENILIKYDKNDKTKFTVKLTDFGESKRLELTNKYSQVGTCRFTAPEILSKKNYNIECDLWSLGILIHVLLFKKYPYNGDNFEAVNKQISFLGRKSIIKTDKTENPYINDLISKLLIISPKRKNDMGRLFQTSIFY